MKNTQMPTSIVATIFLTLFSISIFEVIMKHTDTYAYKEWMKPCSSLDRDGKLMKKKHLVLCDKKDKDSRHRSNKEFEISLGFVIA